MTIQNALPYNRGSAFYYQKFETFIIYNLTEDDGMHQKKALSRNAQYLLILLTPIYFIAIGLLVQPFPEIIDGIIAIIKEPDFLITDYVAVGGVGATLINASLVMIFGMILMYFSGNAITGGSLAGLGLLLGFAMFGKNIANV